MSTCYYLVCKNHDEGVFITDNKGNPPERDDIIEFLSRHVYRQCPISFMNEHEFVKWPTMISLDPAAYE